MASQKLTIRIAGKDDDLSVGSFTVILRRSVEILQEVERSLRANKRPLLRWGIEAIIKRSPLQVTLHGCVDERNAIDDDVASVVMHGWRQIQYSADAFPEHFSERAVESSAIIAKELLNGVKSIEFKVEDEPPLIFSVDLLANASKLTEDHDYYEWTTIDGTLEAVDLHGDEPRFRVYNRIHTNGVSCYFPAFLMPRVKADLPEEAAKLPRVSVYGKARVGSGGRIKSVDVESYEVIAEPPMRDSEGINITGGMDTAEYIARVRYGDES